MAVWLRARSELRSRWRATLSLAVLVAITAGVVMAAAAGARRTHTAYTRFVAGHDAYDIAVGHDQDFPVTPEQVQAIEALPQVTEHVRGLVVYADLGPVGVPFFVPADGRVGTELNRFKLLEGRRPRPDRGDEVVVGFTAADKYDLRVGRRFRLFNPELGAFRIVGIEAAPGEFPPQTQGVGPAGYMTPAAYRSLATTLTRDDGEAPNDSILVRLEPHTDIEAFRRSVLRISPEAGVLAQVDATAATQRSFRLQSLALWLLGALTAFVGLLVLSQAVARQVFLDSRDHRTLGALGMTGGQHWAVAMLRAGMVGAAAAIVGVALAVALSPLTPVGLARTAEPDPGVRWDVPVLALGFVITLLAVPLLASVRAWRAQRRDDTEGDRPSTVASAFGRAGLPVTAVTGARLALEPGRGRTAVPVRTTAAIAVVAVASVAAALTFGAGLEHLLATPRLFGQDWDTTLTTFGEATIAPGVPDLLRAEPAVEAFSVGVSGPANIEDEAVGVFAIDVPSGTVVPPILEGRAPARADEIALGTRTLERVHKRIGDRVGVSLAGPEVSMRVVGRSVTPLFYGEARLGEGGFATLDGARRLDPSGEIVAFAYEAHVRWAPGAGAAERRRVIGRVNEVVGRMNEGYDGGVSELPPETPTDIVNFGRVESMPLILGAIFAILGAATLAHTLVTAIGRRRRDLAVLKTMGFARRQLTTTVAWQATTLVAIALLIGMPVGVAAGRWAWTLLADQLGLVSEPVTPVPSVALIAPATIVLANLVAVVPGWLAGRIQPAVALRAE